MLSILLLSLVPTVTPTTAVPNPASVRVQDEVEQQIAAAGEDVEKLLALAAAFKEAEDKASARKVYERVIEIDGDHKEARKALRHHSYDGQWFPSYASLSKYRREEKKRMKAKGLVRYNDGWVDEKIVPYLRMGWEEVDGEWVNPVEVKEAAMVVELESKKFQRRTEDGSWIDPADFDKWGEGLYKVGEEWVTEDEAQEYHKEISQWWKYQGEHFVAYSTCDNEANRWVSWWADNAYGDLVRLYGCEPEKKPVFACMNARVQFNSFAAGDQAAQRQQTETGGFSSAHYAYLADIWFDLSGVLTEGLAPKYIGGGVCYYDANDESEKNWGQFAVRHAAGLSYAENIDRAWNTISEALGQQGGGGGFDGFWREKRIPRWMVYGGASYVERYARDKNSEESPWGYRAWGFDQLVQNGGVQSLEGFFPFSMDINDLEMTAQLINASGAVVSFMLDGGCEPVSAKHAAFRRVLKSGESTEPAVAELQAALIENEGFLREFIGLGPLVEMEESPEEGTGMEEGQG